MLKAERVLRIVVLALLSIWLLLSIFDVDGGRSDADINIGASVLVR